MKNQAWKTTIKKNPQKEARTRANPIWRIVGVHLSRNNNEKSGAWHPGILEDVVAVIGSDISGILQEAARVPVQWWAQVMAYSRSVFLSLPGLEFKCQESS